MPNQHYSQTNNTINNELENQLQQLIGQQLRGIYLNTPIYYLTHGFIREFRPSIVFWLMENIKGEHVFSYFSIDCIFNDCPNTYFEFTLVCKENNLKNGFNAPFVQTDDFTVEEIRLYHRMPDYMNEPIQARPDELGQIMVLKSQKNEFIFLYAEMGDDEGEPAIMLFLDRNNNFEAFENSKSGTGWSVEHGDYTINHVLKAVIKAIS